MTAIGVPIEVLHNAVGQIVGIRTKFGELYEGTLNVVSEENMNCQMQNITVTLRNGLTQTSPLTFFRFSEIRSFVQQPQAGPSTSSQLNQTVKNQMTQTETPSTHWFIFVGFISFILLSIFAWYYFKIGISHKVIFENFGGVTLLDLNCWIVTQLLRSYYDLLRILPKQLVPCHIHNFF
ncbi:Small nuclear ribonucleoprotein Sm D3 [Aphelenchoides bicaudatus]|nr:Small nuclear ribonucleoprotein Sm D3 [Aphelenchoides bicaudatus]